MSVIYFEQTRIDKLLGMVRFHNDKIARCLEYNSHITHYNAYITRLKPETSKQQLMDNAIARIFCYAFVANRTAYALQYHETATFDDIQINYNDNMQIPCNKKQLLREISSLLYNLRTNDGNMFLEEKWYQPLECIQDFLKEEIINKLEDANPKSFELA